MNELLARPRFARRDGVAILAVALFASGAGAQTQPAASPGLPAPASEADAWRVRLGIPVWLVGITGDVTVRGNESSPDEDPSDIDLFEAHLSFAAALRAEAQKGRFGLLVDSIYVDVTAEASGPLGSPAEASVEGFIGELVGFYTLQPPPRGERGQGAFRADVLAGARVSWFELGVESTVSSGTSDNSVVDPILGARMQLGIADWLDYKLRGDIGGFGLSSGTTSEFAWNIDTAFECRVARSFDVGLGYRWLDYHFHNGSGSERSEFDARFEGPYLSLSVTF